MNKIIFKRICEVLSAGELFRIISTGEVLNFHSSSGGANFSSCVTVTVNNMRQVEIGNLMLHQIEKVDKLGQVIDDFNQYRDS